MTRDLTLDRCQLVLLDGGDLKAAASDPGLAAMLAEGRTVVTHFTVDPGDGSPQRLGIIMAPPRAPGDHATVLVIEALRQTVQLGAGAVVGTLLLVGLVILAVVLQ